MANAAERARACRLCGCENSQMQMSILSLNPAAIQQLAEHTATHSCYVLYSLNIALIGERGVLDANSHKYECVTVVIVVGVARTLQCTLRGRWRRHRVPSVFA